MNKKVAALLVSAGISGSAAGAVITSRNVDIRLSPLSAVEHVHLKIRIEEAGDIVSWGSLSFDLDDHIKINSASVEIRNSEGKKKRSFKTSDFRKRFQGGSHLYSSSFRLSTDLPGLAKGDLLTIDYEKTVTPVFRNGWEAILLNDSQEELSIHVSGSRDALRWKVNGIADLVEIDEDENGLWIRGKNLPRFDPPDHCGDLVSAGPVLVYAWDPARNWKEIAAWYRGKTDGRRKGVTQAGSRAVELTNGLGSNREKVQTLVHFLRENIRYEAVEIGKGGWFPTPADEVLSRGWGDCKDQSELLRSMLDAIDIRAYLVLVHSGRHGNIDPMFPATIGINHCIVAVDASQLAVQPIDPVAEGFFFIDPTMERGGFNWLNPADWDQWALVCSDPGVLVNLPSRPQEEGRALTIEGVLDSRGTLHGRARLSLVGSRALRWIFSLDREAPERIEEMIRSYFQHILPGMELGGISFSVDEDRIPRIVFLSNITRSRFLVSGRYYRLRTSFLGTLPGTRELENRKVPVVLMPGINHTFWRLQLPDDVCIPAADESSVSNSIGKVERRTEKLDDGSVGISCRIVVRRAWIGPESLEQLRELGHAEDLAGHSRLKWRCASETP